MTGDLGTTNILLGIMAAISILEGLVIIGLGVGGHGAGARRAHRARVGAVR